MDNTIALYKSGIHNVLPSEKIPEDAAKDSLNFVTKDGKVVLVYGREALGTEGVVGDITGLHIGYKVNGDRVIYQKSDTAIQYWDGSAWQNSITGLTSTAEYVLQNYSSLAGAFTFVNGPDGYWKIINSHPASPIDIYNASINFKGKILIDKGRTFLWDRTEDKTGLYGSHIDRQDATVYTQVTNEAIGAMGSSNYTGTLAFKGGGSRRSCFGVSFTATVGAGTELFTDNYLGVLTSNFGGTGTINYATGAYNITFSAVTTGAVTSNYQWEDSADDGIADFTKSATRLAGEGFVFPQDEGGDAILKVEIGQDGAYYSLKEKSAYRLSLDADDLGADNEVYRKEMGLPFFRASVSMKRGIVFMNTANPTKPQLTLLEKNKISESVEPVILFPQFKFENYEYDECAFSTYDRWVVIFCKSIGADNNNRMLMCNLQDKTVDVVGYSGKMGVQDGETFYIGDSVTRTVHSIFSGFDDMGLPIQANWDSKDFLHGTENLKKERRIRFKGLIDPDQVVAVYSNADESGFELIGRIRGDGSYVNYNESQAIGATMVGGDQIGGDDSSNAYGYYLEIKLRTPKFRTFGIRLVPEGIGYFDFDLMTHWDILIFENRLPKIYRQKQNVSLTGDTNQ